MLASLQIIAAGVTGEEIIDVEIGGAVAQSFSNLGQGAYTGDFVELQLNVEGNLSANDVRIAFKNDLYEPQNGIDRNVRIDAIVIDGVRFETEDPGVFSTGTWLAEDGVTDGFRESDILHTNGYFQYAETVTGGDGLVVINELHYNPGPDDEFDSDSEYLELYNGRGRRR